MSGSNEMIHLMVTCNKGTDQVGPTGIICITKPGGDGSIPPKLNRVLEESFANYKLSTVHAGVECNEPPARVLQVLQQHFGLKYLGDFSDRDKKMWIVSNKTSPKKDDEDEK